MLARRRSLAQPVAVVRWGGVPGHRRDRLAQGRVAPADESGEAPFERSSVQQDMATASPATQADVRAESVDQPFLATARMGAPQQEHVAKAKVDYGSLSGRHGPGPSAGATTPGATTLPSCWRPSLPEPGLPVQSIGPRRHPDHSAYRHCGPPSRHETRAVDLRRQTIVPTAATRTTNATPISIKTVGEPSSGWPGAGATAAVGCDTTGVDVAGAGVAASVRPVAPPLVQPLGTGPVGAG